MKTRRIIHTLFAGEWGRGDGGRGLVELKGNRENPFTMSCLPLPVDFKGGTEDRRGARGCDCNKIKLVHSFTVRLRVRVRYC